MSVECKNCDRKFAYASERDDHMAIEHGVGFDSTVETAPEDAVPRGESTLTIGQINVDVEELELVYAMQFLYDWDTDDVIVAALNDLFVWARGDQLVQEVIEIKRRRQAKAPTDA